MCGDYHSVIGMEKAEPMRRVRHRHARKSASPPRAAPPPLSGLYVETDDRTGAASLVRPVRIGGALLPEGPADAA